MKISGGRLEFQMFKWGYRHSCHFGQFVLRIGEFIEIDWIDIAASNQMSIIEWFGRCPKIITTCLLFNHFQLQFQAILFSVIPILLNFWCWCNFGILKRDKTHDCSPVFGNLWIFGLRVGWWSVIIIKFELRMNTNEHRYSSFRCSLIPDSDMNNL